VQVRAFLGVLLVCALVAACGGGGGNRNNAPTASAATLTLNEDQTGTVSPAVGDPDNDALTASIAAAPAKGTASVTASQPLAIAYVPNANANGTDGFDYRVSDGRGGTATAHVTVTIAPLPDPPAMTAQAFAPTEDVQFDATVVASEPDGDAMTFSVATPPAHGTLQFTNAATGAFRYVPASDFNGGDSFAVAVADAGGLTATAQMTLAVQAVNDAPVAVADGFIAATSGTTAFDVLANDVDVDDTQLTVELVSTAPGASTVVVGNKIEVTPAPGALGPSSLVYRIKDSSGASATATVRFVIGSTTPVFYRSDQNSPGESRLFRFDGLNSVEIPTPVGANEQFSGFATSADGRTLIYTTVVKNSLPLRVHLWFKDLTDDTAFVEEIPTPTVWSPLTFAVSPDGEHIVFGTNYASRANLSQPFSYASGTIAWPRFTKNSDFLYYAQFLDGGGRLVNRVALTPGGGLGSTQQMTGSPGTAEGLGLTLGLSPDESLIASTGLVLTQWGPKSYAYVTPADGLRNDVLLHPSAVTVVDGARQPTVTADNAYAYYSGTMNGVDGLYSTNLQAPGTAVRIDHAPAGFFVNDAVVLPDSRTMFYNVVQLGGPTTWHKIRLDQPGIFETYAPTGLSDIRSLLLAPDGSALLLTSGSNVYVTDGSPFLATTQLLSLPGTTIFESPLYAPDGRSVAVHIGAEVGQLGRLYLVNPKIPGWSQDLTPGTGTFGIACAVYPGSGC
jgi:hypothetical protein